MTPLSRTVALRRAVGPLRVGRRLTASAAAVAALVAVSVAPVVGVAPVSSTTEPLVVGSYNIQAGVSTGTFQHALDDFRSGLDVAGLQEVNSKPKEAVLAGMRSDGFGYFRDKPGEQSPVIWRQSRLSFLSGRTAQIAKPRYIGNEAPARGSYTHPGYASVVHLQERGTGRKISVINVHLSPGAVVNGQPAAGRPLLFKAFRASIVGLGYLTSDEKKFGTVFVLGDFNIGWVQDVRTHRYHMPNRTFARRSMASMWATDRPDGKTGSHVDSPALIDQVYSTQKAGNADVRYGVTYSDHFPVVATYPFG